MSDWRKRAACFGMPTEWWYPDGVGSPKADPLVSKAKAICAQCPVQLDCLDWALHHDEDGIWGGLTEVQVRRERKTQGIVLPPQRVNKPPDGHLCGTEKGYQWLLRRNRDLGLAGTVTCDPCRLAHNAYAKAIRVKNNNLITTRERFNRRRARPA